MKDEKPATENDAKQKSSKAVKTEKQDEKPREIGGRNGPDPARYGDWELNGKCVDF